MEHISKVKTVLFSGEPMPIKTIRYWLEYPAADYCNVYALTELSGLTLIFHLVTVFGFLGEI